MEKWSKSFENIIRQYTKINPNELIEYYDKMLSRYMKFFQKCHKFFHMGESTVV